MSDRPPAADPAGTSGGYGSPQQEPGPAPHPGAYGTGPGEPGAYGPGRPDAYAGGPGEPGAYGSGPDAYAGGPGAYQAGPYAGGPGPDGNPGPYAAGESYPGQPYPGGQPYAGGPMHRAQPRVRVWPPTRPEWTAVLGILAAFALLGALLAPLWEQLAPRLAFRVDQPGRALPVVPEAEEYVAADARFVLLTLAAGVVVGLACWFLRSSRGPLVLLALAVGGLLGALVTWRLGLWLGPGFRPEDLQVVGNTVYQPLTLRAKAALVVEPVAAVIVYLLAVGFSSRNDLGREDDPQPDPRVSSGSG